MTRINHSSDHLPEIQRGELVSIMVDGKEIEAYRGETVAAAMLAAGIRTFNLSLHSKKPRSLYCGMGVCYECLVTINGVHAQRACVTYVQDGMKIETCKEVEL